MITKLASGILLGSLLGIFSPACGHTTIVNDNLLFSAQPGKFQFTVSQDVAGQESTGVWFDYDGANLIAELISADEGSDWYVVSKGDRFTPESIEAGAFPPLVSFGQVLHPSAFVGTEDFYLGVATGTWEAGPRSVFGWVHMKPDASLTATLALEESVLSYGSPGIVVGTTTLAPEPSISAMAIGAFALTGIVGRGLRYSRSAERA
jgi:hypothetical protein